MSTYTDERQVITYNEILDTETGEITQQVTSQVIEHRKFYKTHEEFIQIYLEDMSGLLSITSKSELQVLCLLWKYSTYNENDKGNCVLITPKIINDLVTATGLAIQSVRNVISSLVKNPKRLLIKDPQFRSTYYLNPVYFFKGALKDRPKVVQVLLSYENEFAE
jgi:hypothetical protein